MFVWQHRSSERTHRFRLCSDFLVPDYLSQVQEEEEALGVQYELEESQHHAASSTAAASSSSSSVHLPVISQVSSSTQNCENFTGFRSPEPLEVQASPGMDEVTAVAAVEEEAKMDNDVGGNSPAGALDQEQRQQGGDPAPITIA